MRRILSIPATLGLVSLHAQELVPNGDFEAYTQCPDYVSQIDRATGWLRPTNGTSDYFNACLGVPFSESVPDNEFGFEPALSGDGYAGFYCFYSTVAITSAPDNDHEYVTHALATPLTPGATYAVEFFVSLADVSKYAVNDLGALLSVNVPVRADEFAITSTPQITNTTLDMLDDKDGWTRISGCFLADSAFAYITIGNFHAGPATVFAEVPTAFPLTYYSYYYVDDVSVRPMDPPQLGPDISTCSAVQLAVPDPVNGATYTWSTGEEGTSIVVETSGVYHVTMDRSGCLLSDTVIVDVDEPLALTLPNDTSIALCGTSAFTIATGPIPPNADVIWSTGATSTSIHVTEAGTYSVSASAPDHCPASASILISDVCQYPVFAPNAFSPDGDGINDTWRPVWQANDAATWEVTIMDRWGNILFGASGRSVSWDGTVDGRPMPTGVYAWSGHAHDPINGGNTRLSGHVMLIR
ncbi:MAG TPA: gliding motility-associated C-terminal domain-containing protein [Flavobacteriales bacterium]|nr:gliding motility-associated C-terminal domain-containing protein [Flavobacteriales bacterium]